MQKPWIRRADCIFIWKNSRVSGPASSSPCRSRVTCIWRRRESYQFHPPSVFEHRAFTHSVMKQKHRKQLYPVQTLTAPSRKCPCATHDLWAGRPAVFMERHLRLKEPPIDKLWFFRPDYLADVFWKMNKWILSLPGKEPTVFVANGKIQAFKNFEKLVPDAMSLTAFYYLKKD